LRPDSVMEFGLSSNSKVFTLRPLLVHRGRSGTAVTAIVSLLTSHLGDTHLIDMTVTDLVSVVCH